MLIYLSWRSLLTQIAILYSRLPIKLFFSRYGYVDPDGQVRDFTYESGIPCDPLTKQPLVRDPTPSNQVSEVTTFSFILLC